MTGYAIMTSFVEEDGQTSLSLDYNSLSSDLERVRNSAKEGDIIRKIRINYGHDPNYVYTGYAFKTPDNKLIVASIQPTPQDTRLRGGEGTVFPVRMNVTEENL